MFLNKLKKFSFDRYCAEVKLNKAKKIDISKGDTVLVIAGDDKGKTGVVSLVDKKRHLLIVSGVNLVKKSIKKQDDAQHDQNFAMVEKFIHLSNVKKVANKN